jgi:hypothetical protein
MSRALTIRQLLNLFPSPLQTVPSTDISDCNPENHDTNDKLRTKYFPALYFCVMFSPISINSWRKNMVRSTLYRFRSITSRA